MGKVAPGHNHFSKIKNENRKKIGNSFTITA